LDKDEQTRLGSRSGASEVKQHKWFSKINWGLLRNTRPPVSGFPKPPSALSHTWITAGPSVQREPNLSFFFGSGYSLTFVFLPPFVPQIVPLISNGHDAVNFRQMKESQSLHLEDQISGCSEYREDELDLAMEKGDLFEAFNSVTLHYDGES
jgi:protein-serine/threonine kinase